MYTLDWINDFIGFSGEEVIDLQKYAQFHESHLSNKNFHFHTSHPMFKELIIESRMSQLPHLMGLQHFKKLPITNPTKQCEQLICGNWDLPFLEKSDSAAYKENKERIHFLPHLYSILHGHEGTLLSVNRHVPPHKSRKVDMIFRKDQSKLEFHVELRSKGVDSNRYSLVSITVHNKKAKGTTFKSIPLKVIDIKIESTK